MLAHWWGFVLQRRVAWARPPAVKIDEPLPRSGGGDAGAYGDAERVARRIAKVIISGREYDPFDPGLIDRIEYFASLPPPELENEIKRHDEKLSRHIHLVDEDSQTFILPIFRPVLRSLPSLSHITESEIVRYQQETEAAIREERRRIIILLSES